MKIAVVITKRYELKAGAKSSYNLIDQESQIMTDDQVQSRLVDSMSFFRKLGGSESLQRAYTCAGYMPIKLTSNSPNRQIKSVRYISWPRITHVYIRRRMYFVDAVNKLSYGYRSKQGKCILFDTPKKATRTMMERV